MRHRPVLISIAVLCLLAAGCAANNDPAAAPAGVAPAGVAPVGIASTADIGSAENPIAGAPAEAGGPTGSVTEGTDEQPGQAPGFVAGGELTASGLGPYQVASRRKDLKKAELLGKVVIANDCPDFAVAKGLKRYHSPSLVFYRGALQYTTVTNAKAVTAVGAHAGMKIAELKELYPTGKQLEDWDGAVAWFVQSGPNALLFRYKNKKVDSIEAGLAEPLQFRFTDGEGC